MNDGWMDGWMKVHVKEKVVHEAAASGFYSCYLISPLPHVLRHLAIETMCRVRSFLVSLNMQ